MAKGTIHSADLGKQRYAFSIAERERQHMALRPELLLKPPTQEHVDRVGEAVNDILSGLDRGEDVRELIRSLTDLTGREYNPRDFEKIESRMSEDDFVREAAVSAARVVPDITRDELIEIVRLAMRSTHEMPDTIATCSTRTSRCRERPR